MNYNELNFDVVNRERELSMSAAFPALMRKVYVWMTLALVITGATAYGVATSPGLMMAIKAANMPCDDPAVNIISSEL